MSNEILTGVKTVAIKSVFNVSSRAMVKFELEDGTSRNLLFTLRAFNSLVKLTSEINGAFDVELLRYSAETPELVTDVIVIEQKEQKDENMEKIEALAQFLSIKVEEGETLDDYLTETSYEDDSWDYGNETYLVLTDEEADEAVWENISQSLWAFNPSFLSGITGLPELVFSALQEQMSEDANDTIRELVGRKFDRLVREAVSSDGRGHFMSTYDGQEHELGDYLIYRTN